MGCPLSSLSYDALLKDAYADCVAKYPDFVQFGITDDFPAFIPPPSDGNWNALYVRIQQRLAHLDSLTNPLGIFRNDKGALLLPPGAPPPPPNLLSGPQALRPTYDGIIIAGAPIGTPDFVSSFLSDKLSQWQSKIKTVTHLGHSEPQIAYHVLSDAASAPPTSPPTSPESSPPPLSTQPSPPSTPPSATPASPSSPPPTTPSPPHTPTASNGSPSLPPSPPSTAEPVRSPPPAAPPAPSSPPPSTPPTVTPTSAASPPPSNHPYPQHTPTSAE